MTTLTSCILVAHRIAFTDNDDVVTTVFGSRLPGHERIVDHIQANDYSGAIQIKTVPSGRAYANIIGPGGERRVLMPAVPVARRRRSRRPSLNGPVTVTRP